MIDPEYERYRRKHPRFPGVAETVRLLKLGGTQGSYLEAVLGDLRENAALALDEVTAAVERERDERVRILLVSVLAETADGRLVGFFTNLLDDPNESVVHWAEVGLQQVDDKAARRALFEHRHRRDDT